MTLADLIHGGRKLNPGGCYGESLLFLLLNSLARREQ